jgi:hypothetical protein
MSPATRWSDSKEVIYIIIYIMGNEARSYLHIDKSVANFRRRHSTLFLLAPKSVSIVPNKVVHCISYKFGH